MLVDEFQDTNHAQLELVRLLAGGPGPNITVVGDDDQAIYRWRGAASANLLAFRRLLSRARAQVVLTENHRSTQVILDAAGAAHLLQQPVPAGGRSPASTSGCARRAADGPGRAPRALRHASRPRPTAWRRLIEARLRPGFRPRDVAHPGAQQRRRRRLPARAQRARDPAPLQRQPRALRARRGAPAGLRSCGRWPIPDDSVAVFYLAASELYRVPERRPAAPQPLRPPQEPAAAGGPACARRLPERTPPSRAAPASVQRDCAAGGTPARAAGTTSTGPPPTWRGCAPARCSTSFLQRSGLLARLAARGQRRARGRGARTSRASSRSCAATATSPSTTACPPSWSTSTCCARPGDDPAVAEADPDDDAVHVLTVHKAKGLEFPVVFIVGCAEDELPGAAPRATRSSCPPSWSRSDPAGGDAHLQEERRLFYVAMTRAKRRAGADLGGRLRHRRGRASSRASWSRPSTCPRRPPAAAARASALEALARHQAAGAGARAAPAARRCRADARCACRSARSTTTRPVRSSTSYVHVLRVPLLVHHRVVYGNAVHKAVQQHFQARLRGGRSLGEDDLVAAFRAAWVSEGFLSREHEEQRLRAGEELLRRFHRQDSGGAARARPRSSRSSRFPVDRHRGWRAATTSSSQERGPAPRSSTSRPAPWTTRRRRSERARDSLQLDVYALAQLRDTRPPARSGRAALPRDRALPAARHPHRWRRPRAPRSRVREIARPPCGGASSRPGRPGSPAASAPSATSAPTPPAPPNRDRDPFGPCRVRPRSMAL